MPIYEYKCQGCEGHFEKIQKATDEPLKVCEECGGELVKQWSLSGFQFKGEGWYVTDYASKKNGAAKSGSDKKGSESTASGDSASEGESKKSKTEKPSKSEKE